MTKLDIEGNVGEINRDWEGERMMKVVKVVFGVRKIGNDSGLVGRREWSGRRECGEYGVMKGEDMDAARWRNVEGKEKSEMEGRGRSGNSVSFGGESWSE